MRPPSTAMALAQGTAGSTVYARALRISSDAGTRGVYAGEPAARGRRGRPLPRSASMPPCSRRRARRGCPGRGSRAGRAHRARRRSSATRPATPRRARRTRPRTGRRTPAGMRSCRRSMLPTSASGGPENANSQSSTADTNGRAGRVAGEHEVLAVEVGMHERGLVGDRLERGAGFLQQRPVPVGHGRRRAPSGLPPRRAPGPPSRRAGRAAARRTAAAEGSARAGRGHRTRSRRPQPSVRPTTSPSAEASSSPAPASAASSGSPSA